MKSWFHLPQRYENDVEYAILKLTQAKQGGGGKKYVVNK